MMAAAAATPAAVAQPRRPRLLLPLLLAATCIIALGGAHTAHAARFAGGDGVIAAIAADASAAASAPAAASALNDGIELAAAAEGLASGGGQAATTNLPPPPGWTERDPEAPGGSNLPSPTHAGYLTINANAGSKMYYMFYEAEEVEADEQRNNANDAPILLWLQGGPGCSSLFGLFYLCGRYALTTDLKLRRNPGSWGRHYGMLFVDQPVGVGFSVPGTAAIPREELALAADLYASLQAFYERHSAYRDRPLFVLGESYAGKYVPSISHYILQAAARGDGTEQTMKKTRPLAPGVRPPLFKFGGAAIGNGFTDAVAQTRVQAEVAWNMGLIDTSQRRKAEELQNVIIELVLNKQYGPARKLSDGLLAFITNSSATATLEDVRRNKAYDAEDRVSKYLNLAAVKRRINAPASITYAACSTEVDHAMGHDVMRSTAKLVPDIVARSHLLIYLGQWDAECGVASNEAWLSSLPWPGHTGFLEAERRIWRAGADGAGGGAAPNEVLGYYKSHRRLSQVVVRNAGHMVPHDRPEVSQRLIENWVESVRSGQDAWDPSAAARAFGYDEGAEAAAAASAAAA